MYTIRVRSRCQQRSETHAVYALSKERAESPIHKSASQLESIEKEFKAD